MTRNISRSDLSKLGASGTIRAAAQSFVLALGAFVTGCMCSSGGSSLAGSGGTAALGSAGSGGTSVAFGGSSATGVNAGAGGSDSKAGTSGASDHGGGASAGGSPAGADAGAGGASGMAGDGATAGQSGNALGGSSSGTSFVHPGLLHTAADLERMQAKVAANASPWVDGWNVLVANSHASLSYQPNPQTEIHRNDGMNPDNYMIFANDVAAAYACALRWKISGDDLYADKAVEILNGWAATLTAVTWSDGHYDGYLVMGLQGYQIVNAAEIMRTYARWSAADFASFKAMISNVFYAGNTGLLDTPSSISVYSNWDLAALNADLAMAVLTDDRSLFDRTLAYFAHGLGNGGIMRTVDYIHPGYLGQTQEAGRDQGHDTLSLALLGTFCEMAWNQGVDLYGYENNRVLAAAEYVAKGNLIESGTSYYSVPFARYTNGGVVNTEFSTGSQGNKRPEWALFFNHYVNRRGLAAPYTQKFMLLVQPEGGGGNYGQTSGGYDQLGYGTLAFTRDPIASGAAPSGLSARVSQGKVTLSWWGGAYASGYSVKRSSAAGGPYATVASGVSDLLSYTDVPDAEGTYYYVVTATTSAGESEPSNEVRAVTRRTEPSTSLSFDEALGSAAADASGNAHHAMLAGSAAWSEGHAGSAVSFDGTTGYVSLPPGVVSELADFTISAWVYLNDAKPNARIFDFGGDAGTYMMLTPCDGSKVARFAVTMNLRVGEQSISGAQCIPTGRWVHVAVTLAGTVGMLYVDKVAVGSNDSLTLPPFQLGHTANNWLGRSEYAADPYLNGRIDDFRIYSGALNADELAGL